MRSVFFLLAQPCARISELRLCAPVTCSSSDSGGITSAGGGRNMSSSSSIVTNLIANNDNKAEAMVPPQGQMTEVMRDLNDSTFISRPAVSASPL